MILYKLNKSVRYNLAYVYENTLTQLRLIRGIDNRYYVRVDTNEDCLEFSEHSISKSKFALSKAFNNKLFIDVHTLDNINITSGNWVNINLGDSDYQGLCTEGLRGDLCLKVFTKINDKSVSSYINFHESYNSKSHNYNSTIDFPDFLTDFDVKSKKSVEDTALINDSFLLWLYKLKLTGDDVDIDYKLDSFNRIRLFLKKLKLRGRLELPEGIYEVYCDCSCDELILPKSCKLLSGTKTCRIKSIICKSDEIVVLDYAFKENAYIESFECNNVIVGSYSFSHCERLENFVCEESRLHKGAFYACEQLKEFKVKGVFLLEDNCFAHCYLLNFDFSKLYCDTIGRSSFEYCSAITSVDLYYKDRLEYGTRCFSGCNNLQHVRLSKTSIFNDSVFNNCKNLVKVIMFDAIFKDEKFGIFAGCEKLQKVENY